MSAHLQMCCARMVGARMVGARARLCTFASSPALVLIYLDWPCTVVPFTSRLVVSLVACLLYVLSRLGWLISTVASCASILWVEGAIEWPFVVGQCPAVATCLALSSWDQNELLVFALLQLLFLVLHSCPNHPLLSWAVFRPITSIFSTHKPFSQYLLNAPL